MNKTFRSVWNRHRQVYIAAAETVSGQGAPASAVRLGAVLAVVLGGAWGLSALAQTAPPPNTLPTGGQVSAGQANIRQHGTKLVIDQGTDRAAINWQSFDVGSNAQVHFNQPGASSVALNRVLSSDPSQIFGRISANGQVVLTNPQGVYFGPSARVDVGGLIATTHGIGDADFMAGKLQLERKGSSGKVVNEGELKAALGGYIALLAPEVRNQGAVITQMGTVALAAGETVDLRFDRNNRLTSIRVTPSQIQTLVDNRMAVQAPGGLVIVSAQSLDLLVGGVVRNSGTIEATGLQMQGGRIVLAGSSSVHHSGTLDASSAQSQGGDIRVTGRDITLTETAMLDARGAMGGGTVRVGGDWQGGKGLPNPLEQADKVTMAPGARIDASATDQGDGGTIVLWSDAHKAGTVTTAQGTLLAKGGPHGGNGGRIETSGSQVKLDGLVVDAAAPKGEGGLWLIDPYDYTIDSAAAEFITPVLNGGTSVTVDTLALNTSQGSSTDDSQQGNISVTAPVTWTGSGSLTLNASGSITIGASGNTGSLRSQGAGNITLNAGGTGGISGSTNGSIQIGATSGVTAVGILTLNPTDANASGTLNGVISGRGAVIKNGAGALKLAARNIYTGNTTINGGTLDLSGTGGIYTGTDKNGTDSLVINSGAVLVGDRWEWAASQSLGQLNFNLNNIRVNGGTIRNMPSGPGANFFGDVNGARLLNVGSLGVTLDNAVAGNTWTIARNSSPSSFTNSSPLRFSGAGNVVFLADINGPGVNVQKSGSGQVTLSGTNTYTGRTTVSEGTLLFSRPASLYNNNSAGNSWTASNIVVANGATLGLGVGTSQFSAFNVANIAALGTADGGFMSGSYLGLDTSAGDFTYTSRIQNTNGGNNALGLSKLGSGTLTLTPSVDSF